MKTKLLLSVFMLFAAIGAWAQSPKAFNYQSVVRDANGNPYTNAQLTTRFTILDAATSGNILYQETQTLITNRFGLFTTKIGNGTPVQGIFADLSWTTGEKYLQIEIEVGSSTTFENMGITQLVSVPYALHADTASYSLNNAGPPAVKVDTVFTGLNNFSVTVTSANTPLGVGTLSFIKQYPNSNVELLLASNIYVGTFNGAAGVGFVLEIDGNPANYTTQYYILQSNTQQYVTLDAVFAGLSTGPHTVTLMGVTDAGTATNVGVDNGGWGGSIMVKETN